MKKIIKKLLLTSFAFILFGTGLLVSCKKNNSSSSEINSVSSTNKVSSSEEYTKQKAIYELARASGYTGTYEEWLDSIKGDEIELDVRNGEIKWRYVSSNTWTTLVSLEDLVGEQGPKGDKGDKGDTGEQGETGEKGEDGKSLHTGEGVPSSNLGNEGDSYIDLSNWDFYVKSETNWELKGSIYGGSDNNSSGTLGLDFYPLNDTECAVAVGKARYLKNIVIPDTYQGYKVTEIVDSGFAECTDLETITLSKYTKNIGNRAFYLCDNLKNVTIPKSVENIGEYAFALCVNLCEIYNLSDFEINEDNKDDFFVAVFPYIHTSLEEKSIYVESEYDDFTFITLDGEYFLTKYSGDDSEVELPTSINGESYYIRGGAFFLKNIESVYLPYDIKGFKDYAFTQCDIDNIVFNGTISDWLKLDISDWSNPLSICDSFYYLDENGELTNDSHIIIPEGTTVINENLFHGFNGINKITLPSTLLEIKDNAFYECSNLKSIINNSKLELTNGSSKHGYVAYYADGINETVITFCTAMGSNLKSIFDTYLVKFNEEYPDITVVVNNNIGGYDAIRDEIALRLSTGQAPDVTYCYADHVALYNKVNAVVDLEEYINNSEYGLTNEEYANYIPMFLEEGYAFGDDKLYMMPWSKSTELMYYNKDVFEQNNLLVPTHWFSMDENDTNSMEYVLYKLKELYPDSIPLGYDSEANLFITLCKQLGLPYTSVGSNHFLFNTPEHKEFVNKLKEWFDHGLITTQQIYGSYTSGLLTTTNSQKSFMTIGSSAGAIHNIPANDAFTVGMAPLPQEDGSYGRSILQGPSVCILNNGNEDKILASWLFVKWFTSNVDFQVDFSIASGYMPVVKSVYDNSKYTDFLSKAYNTSYSQKERASSYSLAVCSSYYDSYFTVPAFIGSSEARTQVGNIITLRLLGYDIDTIFDEAIAKCNAAI